MKIKYLDKIVHEKLDKINDEQCNNFEYMSKKVNENYRYYMFASDNLKKDYSFSMQGIYSCLSKINTFEDKNTALRELSAFLLEVRTYSGLNMQPICTEKNTIGVIEREKPKIKTRKK